MNKLNAWLLLVSAVTISGMKSDPIKLCIEKVIQAPIDHTDTEGSFPTTITGANKYEDLGGEGNEVNISSLVRTMKEDESSECGCPPMDCPSPHGPCSRRWHRECTHEKCVQKLLENYIRRNVRDMDGSGRITCDDAAILLYVGHRHTHFPVSIKCSFFWSAYSRNAAYLKHSQGVDVNDFELLPMSDRPSHPLSEALTNSSLGSSSKPNNRELDSELFFCRNGQCKWSQFGKRIERCDGHIGCADNSDEENCPDKCPENSVTCILAGTPTCLQEYETCRFKPEKCWDYDNNDISVANCTYASAIEKFRDCKVILDKLYRKAYGESEEGGWEDGLPIPEASYRDTLCRANDRELDYGQDQEEALGEIPPSLTDFKYINFNESNCQDKIDQSYGSCLDDCNLDDPPQNLVYWQCNDGRCINDLETRRCDSKRDCRDGEDEMVAHCLEVSYYDSESEYFPCPKTGKLIPPDQVCNGVKDCTDGEDEDSHTWFEENPDFNYTRYTRNWTSSYRQTCFKRTSKIRLSSIIVFLFFMALLLAILLEKRETTCLSSKKLGKRSSQLENEIDAQIDQQIHLYKTDHEMSFDEVEKAIKGISLNVINSVVSSQGEHNPKAISKELRKYNRFITINDYVTSSVGIKLKRSIYSHLTVENEKKLNAIAFGQVPTFFKLIFSFLTFIEYFIEISLMVAYYDAFLTLSARSSGSASRFTLGPYFQGLFYANLFVMVLAYICLAFIGCRYLPFDSKHVPQLISRILFPFYFPVLNAIHFLKTSLFPSNDFEKYQKEQMVAHEYHKVFIKFSIIKIVTENVPQQALALLFYFSDPLTNNVLQDNSSPFSDFKQLAVVVLAKSFLSLLAVSWSITTFYNSQKHFDLGIVGRILISLSNLLFMVSRVSCVVFCLIFSSCYPDMQFYLYYLSEARTYLIRSSITPAVIEEMYKASISAFPAIIVLMLFLVLPLIYGFVLHFFIQPRVKEPLKTNQIVLVSIVNVFSPFIPNITFHDGVQQKGIVLLNCFIYILFFVVNIILALIPIMFYGLNYFSLTLPVLDELCRFYSFIRFNDFPSSFPKVLPNHFLNGHIIFPVISLIAFLLALPLKMLYRHKFHPNLSFPSEVIEMATAEENSAKQNI